MNRIAAPPEVPKTYAPSLFRPIILLSADLILILPVCVSLSTGSVVPIPTLPSGDIVNLSAPLELITKAESVPTLNKVEVADWRESLRIESEEVL